MLQSGYTTGWERKKTLAPGAFSAQRAAHAGWNWVDICPMAMTVCSANHYAVSGDWTHAAVEERSLRFSLVPNYAVLLIGMGLLEKSQAYSR